MANRRDDYMNKRSYLIDTAETPKDKKTLKSDLKKLDAKFNPNRVASASKTKTAPEAKTAMRAKIIKMNAKKTDSSAAARRLIAKKKAGKK